MYPHDYNSVSNIFFRDQAEALVKYGHKVGVLAIVPITIQSILRNKKITFGLKIFIKDNVITWLYQFPVPPKSQRFQQWCRKKIGLWLYRKYQDKNGKPDIQHVHTYKAAATAMAIKGEYQIPIVITEHSSTLLKDKVKKYNYKIAEVAFLSSKVNIAVSNQFCNILKSKYDIDFIYVPNVVDIEYFKPVLNQDKKDKRINLLNVANLVEIKNHIMLFIAFKNIKKSFPNLYLYIVGDGLERRKLEEYINESKMETSVFFLGKLSREEVRNQMQMCDIFILSSKMETFGVVLIEAMACGKPVVSTKSGGPESIIVNPFLGELVENNEAALVQGLYKVITQLKNYDNDEIRCYVEENYSYKTIAKRLTEIYEKVLA
jgi:glycosyltransferase involved in cell wall biosynthesis